MNKLILALSTIPLGTLLSAGFGIYALTFLRKLKLGQHIREDGPQSHLAKGGTPTMGGIIFLLPALALTLLFAQASPHTLVILLLVLLIGGLGFYDDLQKVLLRNNKGITPKQKLAGQAGIGALLGLYLMLGVDGFQPVLELPFSNISFSLGWAYIPFVMFFFTATTNSVNLTDGLDGLATTVAIVSLAALSAMLMLQGGLGDPGRYAGIVLGLSTLGGCLGFLWYNSHPAQVFMGDTGSLALGGILSIMACLGHLELWFAIIGLVFVAEALSVMIQVAWYKRTKKRVFRMSPLHHHFELGGWKETQVVNRFGIVAFLLAFISVLAYYAAHLPAVAGISP
ncbi:MAG: phospho-N-acetylmuramoyl-pentapeptide-transferase [Candidatus Melainabacteria bacterium HGW-Melainabacteria-1]|nr:MAG: phospho-N-acetylmuramoyl-pentapeptide-transferase [Candidatus Melainabacteria bacterium HGW-Melainabacteria-1]